MHLATLSHSGAPLPPQLPAALARSAGILAAPSGAISGAEMAISDAEMERYLDTFNTNPNPPEA